MKYFLLTASLLILPFTLFASQDDLSKSKGTTQDVIPQLVSLTLESNTTSLNLGEKAQLKVTATYDNNMVKDVTDRVEWIITPADTVQIGGKVLTALKDTNVTVQAKMETIVSNTLDLEIYWEVDGYRLPPEPDPTVNNATLLGIDSNDNGVRDDVERYIYSRFTKEPEYSKTKTAIAMQYAKAYQFIMANDPQNAFENKSYEKEDYVLDCLGYVIDKGIRKDNLRGVDITKHILKFEVYDNKFKEKIWNTKLRMKAYFYYNSSLSGHILGGGGGVLSSTKDKCDFEIDSLGEL